MNSFEEAKLISYILVLACPFYLYGQPESVKEHAESTQSIRYLSGYSWKLKKMNPGQGIKEREYSLLIS
jgi:hypothetical protein